MVETRLGEEVFNRGEKMMQKRNWVIIKYKGFRVEGKEKIRAGRKGR